ncbi:MAG: MATE family efflux transporter [Desulfovibrio sp.]|nr:MATE family efflux transporter [Desulfovibrio sp.]
MQKFFSWSEARRFYAVGLPIFVAQLAQTGMNFADTAMTGQYHAEDMAAVAVAGSILGPAFVLGIGCLHALSPLCAQSVGERRPDRAAHLMRQGLWLTLGISALLCGFFQGISLCLESLGLEPRLAELAGGYLRAFLWGVPAFLLFVNLRAFPEGFSRTRPAMLLGLLGLACNVPCNYVLIYGKWGFPELGAVGCGWASAVSFWIMALGMGLYVRRDLRRQGLGALWTPLIRGTDGPRLDAGLLLRILRIGLPGALALFLEVALFALSAILLAPLGVITVAGHQIAMNFASLVFMIPLALGMTATIRVGFCLGARQAARARQVARTALLLSAGASLLLAVGIVAFRRQIAGLYTSDDAVAALAAQLLLLQACYEVVDGVQCTGIGILRGHNDTRMISLICLAGYGALGLPLGYALGRTDWLTPAPLGAAGFWISYIVALGFSGACYLLRLRHLHRLAPDAMLERVRR